MCKYTIVLRRHDEIRELLDDLRNDWFSGTEEDQRIYKARATIGQRLVMSFMIFLYTGGTSLRTVTPFLREKIVLPDNTTIRPLLCPIQRATNTQLRDNFFHTSLQRVSQLHGSIRSSRALHDALSTHVQHAENLGE